MGIKVKAKETVYYNDTRHHEGKVFEIKDPSHFSEKSMEDVDGKIPAKSKSTDKEEKQDAAPSKAPPKTKAPPKGADAE